MSRFDQKCHLQTTRFEKVDVRTGMREITTWEANIGQEFDLKYVKKKPIQKIAIGSANSRLLINLVASD